MDVVLNCAMSGNDRAELISPVYPRRDYSPIALPISALLSSEFHLVIVTPFAIHIVCAVTAMQRIFRLLW